MRSHSAVPTFLTWIGCLLQQIHVKKSHLKGNAESHSSEAFTYRTYRDMYLLEYFFIGSESYGSNKMSGEG